MIIKVLGMIDILTGLLFWLFGILGFGNKEIILLLGLVLLIKGVVFIININIMSLLDIIAGLIIISSGSEGIVIPKIIVIIVCLFLLQKGAFSLVG